MIGFRYPIIIPSESNVLLFEKTVRIEMAVRIIYVIFLYALFIISSNTYAKIISEKWNVGRYITDMRIRNSPRLKELRRSNRSAVLNKFRQGLEFSEEKTKKTAVEETLERLKAHKGEKQSRMDECLLLAS